MELLEAIYIESLYHFKDYQNIKKLRNNYSIQDQMKANMLIKQHNITFDYKNIYKNSVLYAKIDFKYNNLISNTTHKRIIKDIIIKLNNK